MNKKEIFFCILVAIFLAVAVSPFASQWPDGLEKVAENKGFLDNAMSTPLLPSPAPDYIWPGIKTEKIATSVAGIIGTLGVFIVAYGVAFALKSKA